MLKYLLPILWALLLYLCHVRQLYRKRTLEINAKDHWFFGNKMKVASVKITLFSSLFDLCWTRTVRRQLVIMHKLRPPAHVHLLYFNITCQRDLLKWDVTFITFSIRRRLLKAIIRSDISVSLHLRAPEMEVWIYDALPDRAVIRHLNFLKASACILNFVLL